MNLMNVSFKSVSNKNFNFNVDPNDTIESVFPQIHSGLNTNPETHTMKVILKGKIIPHSSKFSEFNEEKLSFVFINTKIKDTPQVVQHQSEPVNQVSTNQTQSNSVVQNQTLVQPSQTQVQTNNNQQAPFPNLHNQNELDDQEDGEPADEVDRLRAAVVGVLAFIRANPQLSELYLNNFETLVGVLASPQIRPLFEKMVDEYNSGDSEYLDEFTESVNNQTSTQTNNQNSTQVTLTDTDMQNINTLVALGFPQNECVRAYIVCNKNLDMAASFLMDEH